MLSINTVNPSGERCYEVLFQMCKPHLEEPLLDTSGVDPLLTDLADPMQMSSVYSMMWQNNPAVETDPLQHDDPWTDLLGGQNRYL